MKKGATLIEIIFAILIISFAFSTIPKMIEVSNKTLEFAKKEDAIFNMMAKIMDISFKEYDENNTISDDILVLKHNPLRVLDCNSSSKYRIGGFFGSRNCEHSVFESNIEADSNEPPYDDVDDYNGTSESISYGHTEYNLTIFAGYTDEWDSYDDKSLTFNFTRRMDNNFTNVKRVSVIISKGGKNISSVSYYSANIGHIKIKSVAW